MSRSRLGLHSGFIHILSWLSWCHTVIMLTGTIYLDGIVWILYLLILSLRKRIRTGEDALLSVVDIDYIYVIYDTIRAFSIHSFLRRLAWCCGVALLALCLLKFVVVHEGGGACMIIRTRCVGNMRLSTVLTEEVVSAFQSFFSASEGPCRFHGGVRFPPRRLRKRKSGEGAREANWEAVGTRFAKTWYGIKIHGRSADGRAKACRPCTFQDTESLRHFQREAIPRYQSKLSDSERETEINGGLLMNRRFRCA